MLGFLSDLYTVNLEIYARTLFSRSFVKMKPSRNGKITQSFIDIGKSCLSREFFTSLICLLMLFAKIKILAKISESTVRYVTGFPGRSRVGNQSLMVGNQFDGRF